MEQVAERYTWRGTLTMERERNYSENNRSIRVCVYAFFVHSIRGFNLSLTSFNPRQITVPASFHSRIVKLFERTRYNHFGLMKWKALSGRYIVVKIIFYPNLTFLLDFESSPFVIFRNKITSIFLFFFINAIFRWNARYYTSMYGKWSS